MNAAFIKHFNISEADIAQMQAALLPNQAVLEVLFEKKLVDPVAYLAWAKEHYSLPVLKIEFLDKVNNVDELMARYRNVFPKNIIPFHEMDGVLYVMCLEPTPFEAPQTVQYVLAPYEVISKYTSKNVCKDIEVSQVAIPILEEKENTNPLFKQLEVPKNTLESFSFDNLTPPDATPTAEGDVSDVGNIKLEDKEDVPAGMDFPSEPEEEASFVTDNNVAAVDLNSFSFVGLMPTDGKETPAQAPAPVEAKVPVQPAPTPAPVAAPTTAPSFVTAATPTSAPSSVPVLTPLPTPEVAPTPVAEAPQVIKPKPIKIDTSKPFTPASASSIAARNPPKPKTEPQPVMDFEPVLESMKKFFNQSMVLMFNQGNLEPQAWDKSWTKLPHAQLAIDISTPSIFRIVNETLNPYHGHVVPNQINESFFTNWNGGQYPEHVTICPIIHEKRIFGMILGTTTKENSKKYNLHNIQEIANDIFARLTSNKAA